MHISEQTLSEGRVSQDIYEWTRHHSRYLTDGEIVPSLRAGPW